jgi:hypothetical protein
MRQSVGHSLTAQTETFEAKQAARVVATNSFMHFVGKNLPRNLKHGFEVCSIFLKCNENHALCKNYIFVIKLLPHTFVCNVFALMSIQGAFYK